MRDPTAAKRVSPGIPSPGDRGILRVATESSSNACGPAEEMKLIFQMEPTEQTDFLAMAADIYLRIQDKEHAQEVVKEGFTTANALLQRDLAAPGLKEVPKTVWDAAETYRRIITLGVNASFPSTEAMVQQIPDPPLREYEEIMVARALLGVPVRRYMVMYSSGSSVLGELDVSYDRFS